MFQQKRRDFEHAFVLCGVARVVLISLHYVTQRFVHMGEPREVPGVSRLPNNMDQQRSAELLRQKRPAIEKQPGCFFVFLQYGVIQCALAILRAAFPRVNVCSVVEKHRNSRRVACLCGGMQRCALSTPSPLLDIGSAAQQALHNFGMSFLCSDSQRRLAIGVFSIDIGSAAQHDVDSRAIPAPRSGDQRCFLGILVKLYFNVCTCVYPSCHVLRRTILAYISQALHCLLRRVHVLKQLHHFRMSLRARAVNRAVSIIVSRA
mmetsp:Transcript_8696/g.18543  ORF Transcript_8696/g.18543 Transcript_8696/m.18543 type:complete len:262 (-) Transcript_8696:1112-1897(-)